VEIVIRSTVIFFFLWFLTRATGKRVLSQLSAFELMLLVTVGDLVQQGVTQEDMSLTGNMLAVGTLGVWISVFSYVSYRWAKTRPVIEGLPVVILRDGKILKEALHVERLTEDELREEARMQGIEDLRKVKAAVLEPDGKFSFITGEQHQPDEKDLS
jgi:uncharacterized membrane protein YcaP (DUF421 family)